MNGVRTDGRRLPAGCARCKPRLQGECGFGAVERGHDQLAALRRSGQRGRQHAVDAAQFAGEAKLAQEFVFVEHLQRNLPAGGEDAQRDRQVEAAAVFGQIRRREIYGNDAGWEVVLRALDRGADAVLGFADRGFGQADDGHARQSTGEKYFDFHGGRAHVGACTGVHERKGHGGGPQAWGCGVLRVSSRGAS